MKIFAILNIIPAEDSVTHVERKERQAKDRVVSVQEATLATTEDFVLQVSSSWAPMIGLIILHEYT